MKKKSNQKNVQSFPHEDAFTLVARLFLAGIFAASFMGKLFGFSAQAAWIGGAGFPMPEVLLVIAMVLEAIGVISLVSGCRVHIGAAALILFTLAATFMFHLGAAEMTNFLKNLAIIGGLMLLAMKGPGKYALKH